MEAWPGTHGGGIGIVMKSMTGYACNEYQDEAFSVSVELKSYNNRYLDVNVYLPKYLGVLEANCREYLAGGIGRGKVDLTIRYRQIDENITYQVDEPAISNFVSILNDIVKFSGIEDTIKLSHLLQMEDLVKSERKVDIDAVWRKIQPVLEATYKDFDQQRTIEGQAASKNISSQLGKIFDSVAVFTEKKSELEKHIEDSLRSRFQQVLGDKINEERVLAEMAVLLVRFSIEEEISRLDAHLGLFKEMLKTQAPTGKKLDFLCQEIQREVNTVGSKSTMYEISRTVVDAKDAIENIREQLRNVE